MIMIALGVVYIANDDEYSCKITPTYMNLYECVIKICEESSIFNVEYGSIPYDVM